MKIIASIILAASITIGINPAFADEMTSLSLRTPQTNSFPKKSGPIMDVIKDVTGETHLYEKSCAGYFRNYSMKYVPYKDAEIPAKILFDEDDVYFFNILSKALTYSYAKGVKDGNKITVPLPQTLLYNEQQEDGYNLVRLKPVTVTGDDGEEKTVYEIDNEGDQFATYTISEDGTVTMDKMDNDCGIGLVYISDDKWGGYVDTEQVFEPLPSSIVTLPQDVVTEKWALTFNGTGYYVNVGFDGDDVYIGGMCGNLKEGWVKGKIDNDKIVVPNGQILGIYSDTFYIFVKFAERVNNTITLLPENINFVFDYDMDAKKMTVEDSSILFLFNTSSSRVSVLQMLENFEIHYQNTLAGTPSNPFNLWYSTDNYEWFGFNEFNIDIPRLSTENDLLDPEFLYYHILMDGRILEFTPDKYDVEEAMTDIPYLYENFNDIYSFGGSGRAIGIYNDEIFETLGVQLFYNYDGVLTQSAIATLDIATGDVTYDYPDGVDLLPDMPTVVRRDYYDYTGHKVSQPEVGKMYIERISLSDGSTVAVKTIKR